MQSRLPNLVWLRTFEASARLLNFTQAGAELGLTQTAVSQHIKALESVLGCQLFQRKPRHLALTGMGQAYVHSVRKSLGDINLSTTSLFGPLSQQTITVRAPISTVALWLAPLLPQFTDLYPEINIRLISVIWADSVSAEDVDVDLRIGYGDWPGLQVEKISQETIVPICSAATLSVINHPTDLLNRPLIHILGHEGNWALFFSTNELSMDSVQMRYSVDTSIAALALVSAGVGVATILTRFAKRAVDSGSKIAMVAAPIDFPQSHYLISPVVNGPQKPEVDLFKTWLKSKFKHE
jgi:LysR family glycine cleavage system transcriptional activator